MGPLEAKKQNKNEDITSLSRMACLCELCYGILFSCKAKLRVLDWMCISVVTLNKLILSYVDGVYTTKDACGFCCISPAAGERVT